MAVRRTWPILAVFLTACCLRLACAETTRYRVLSFFFEGVPRPGEATTSDDVDQEAPGPTPGAEAAPDVGSASSAPRYALTEAIRMHPPYWEGRCGVCHSPEGGLTKRTPQEGLCSSCHDIPGSARYAHGPVAVRDCLFCHHHHGGEHPKMLRSDATGVCLRCHQTNDLTSGEHHAPIDELVCTGCHHAHGGDDRFFVKPDRP